MMKMSTNKNIFADRQAIKRLHDLEGSRDTAPRETIRRLAGHVLAGKMDRALVRPDKAGDDRKSVVFPAPLGPISAVICPSWAPE